MPDPLGGRAWKFEAGVIGTRIEPGDTAARDLPQHSCVTFGTSRYRTATSARSPGLCGHSRYGRTGPDRTLFYGARRLSGDRRFTRGLYEGAWNGHPPRTALWGNASRDLVRELVVIEPGGRRHSVRPAVNGAFLVVLDPKVDPAALRVELRFNDGRVQRTGPRRDLVDPEAIG